MPQPLQTTLYLYQDLWQYQCRLKLYNKSTLVHLSLHHGSCWCACTCLVGTFNSICTYLKAFFRQSHSILTQFSIGRWFESKTRQSSFDPQWYGIHFCRLDLLRVEQECHHRWQARQPTFFCLRCRRSKMLMNGFSQNNVWYPVSHTLAMSWDFPNQFSPALAL